MKKTSFLSKISIKILLNALLSGLFYFNSIAANIDPEIIDKAYKSSVSIESRVSVVSYGDTGKWQGTGFIHSIKDGIIITNAHIIGQGAIGNYLITFFNGKNVEAKLKYYSLWQDFAILQIDPASVPKDVTEIKFSDKEPSQNQSVFIVGNNEGQSFSFHDGYLSNVFSINGSMPQHSYVVNLNATGGSSGSPLLNSAGDAIGISYGAGATFSLALKSQYITDALEDLKNNKQPSNKHIGAICHLYSLDKAVKHRLFPKELAQSYLTQFPDSRNNALAVKGTIKGSPAAEKLKSGDIIWAINGQQLGANLYALDKAMNQSKSKQVELTIYRNGQKIQTTIDLYDVNANKIAQIVEFGGAVIFSADDVFSHKSGIPMNSVVIENIANGMSMSSIPNQWTNGDRSFYRANILSINNHDIANLSDLISAVCQLAGNNFIKLDFENYQPYKQNYNEIIISSHEKLSADITLDNIDFNPRVFNFNEQKMQWEVNALPCSDLKKK